MPVVVPVDERGELLGGWARRRQILASSSPQPQVPPMVLRPGWLPKWQGRGRGGGHGGALRRLLEGATQELAKFASDPWWEQQRYVAVMPQLWDQPCMQGVVLWAPSPKPRLSR